MTDGLIGNDKFTVPDLMERVIAFRTLNYSSPHEAKEPNEFKVDIATGKIIRNAELIKQKLLESGEAFDDEVILGNLHSPQYNKETAPWKKEMVARCGAGHRHVAPDHNCSCGLYCYYHMKEFSTSYNYNGREVHCCVSIEGKIEAHNTGMRAEKMRIEAIYALSYSGLKRLCDTLEVTFFPTESYNRDQFLAHCKEYGDPLPINLRAGNQPDKELPS